LTTLRRRTAFLASNSVGGGENRDWGYCRIQGALSNLGHEITHSTISEMLKRHGIEPAPARSRKTTWKDF